MVVKVKLYGYVDIEKIIGKRELDVNISGDTINDLRNYMVTVYGNEVTKMFNSPILKNGKEWIKMNDMNHVLNDGDQLAFLNMITGG